jgi:hypothetical protein
MMRGYHDLVMTSLFTLHIIEANSPTLENPVLRLACLARKPIIIVL